MFKFDPDFEKNEGMYDEIRSQIVGEPGETSEEEESDDEKEEGSEEDNEKGFCS